MEISPLAVSISGDTILCSGDSITLKALSDTTFSWALDTDPTTIIATADSINVWPSVTTTYIVYGSTDTAYHTVTVIDPVAPINLGPDKEICLEEQMLLTAGLPGAATYRWHDGSDQPTFLVVDSGFYWVEASNFCGVVRDEIVITKDECNFELQLPNVFSPDADGVNDQFMPLVSKGIVTMHTGIYNRWGQLVFETDNLDIEWNGNVPSGKQAADGTYYWIIDYNGKKGESATDKGVVTLMR